MPTTPEQREILLTEIAEGKSLFRACKDNKIERTGVYDELNAEPEFANNYARACELRAERVFDDIFDIADDVEAKGLTDRDRLRVDARKWALARMNPRKFGDKITQEHTGEGGGPMAFTVTNRIVDPKADAGS